MKIFYLKFFFQWLVYIRDIQVFWKNILKVIFMASIYCQRFEPYTATIQYLNPKFSWAQLPKAVPAVTSSKFRFCSTKDVSKQDDRKSAVVTLEYICRLHRTLTSRKGTPNSIHGLSCKHMVLILRRSLF